MGDWTNNWPSAKNSTTNMPDQTDGVDTANSSTIEALRDAQIANEAVIGTSAGPDAGTYNERKDHYLQDDVSGQISAVTLKGSPVAADVVLIEDSADSNSKKRATVSSIATYTVPGEQLSSYADLLAAVTAIGSTETRLLIDTDSTVASNVIIPATLTLEFVRGSVLTVNNTYTLTINGPVVVGLWQIFAGSGAVDLSGDSNNVERVPVQWFGATGDGTTDDTEAVLWASEAAFGFDRGDWEAWNGEVVVWTDTHKRPAIYFPRGTYRLTRAIPIRYSHVKYIGDCSFRGADYTSVLFPDHAGDCFTLDRNIGVSSSAYYTTLRGLRLHRASGHASYKLGSGIRATEEEWVRGLLVENCSIRGFAYGILIEADQGLGLANPSFAELIVRDCEISHCAQAMGSVAGLSLSSITDSTFAPNDKGIEIRTLQCTIDNIDLESTPDPLTILEGSTYAKIGSNYYEANTGDYLLDISSNLSLGYPVQDFEISPQFHSGGYDAGNVPIAVTGISGEIYDKGPVEDRGFDNIVHGATRIIHANRGFGGCGWRSQRWTPKDPLPEGATFEKYAVGSATVDFNGVTSDQAFEAPNGAYRIGPNIIDLATNLNEWFAFSFAVKYTEDVPTQDVMAYVAPSFGSYGTYYSSIVYPLTSIQVGDTVYFHHVFQNTAGNSTSVNIYVYLYGRSAGDTGNGAKLSPITVYKLEEDSDGNVPYRPIDPLYAERRSLEEVFLSAYSSLASAITAIGSTETTLIVDRDETVAANVTVPTTLALKFLNGNVLSVDNTYTLTINGPIEAGPYQIFDVSSGGTVAFGGNGVTKVNVKWFGATGDGTTADETAVVAADTAAAATGISLYFPPGSYYFSTDQTLNATARFDEGASIKVANSYTVLVYGEVIAGSYQIFDESLGGGVLFNIPPEV